MAVIAEFKKPKARDPIWSEMVEGEEEEASAPAFYIASNGISGGKRNRPLLIPSVHIRGSSLIW